MVQDNVVKKQVSVVKIVLLAGVLPFVLIFGSLISIILLLYNQYSNPIIPWKDEIGNWVSQTPYIEIESTSTGLYEVYGQLEDRNGNLVKIRMSYWIPRHCVFVASYDIDTEETESLFSASMKIYDSGFILSIYKNNDYVFDNEYPSNTFYKV
ncbi:MAG: hypothetical protein FWF56_05115 [Firmicutes bacterium]|nr:hypothetical protein [Bacillota bacterium]MCL1953351.1 hypothetical protein [Bacillota bacterium]